MDGSWADGCAARPACGGANAVSCCRTPSPALAHNREDVIQETPSMGKRLTQIATRTGDDGTTGLGDNTRVAKSSLRVQAMGDGDELNSHIGLLLCERMPDAVRALLIEVQHQLFNLGGELSIPGFELLKPEALAVLDEALDTHNAQLPKLEEFILPAGTRGA